MNVLHSGSLDVTSGGPAKSTYLTLKGLINNGVNAKMLMYPLLERGKLIGEDVDIKYTQPLKNARFAYMPNLGDSLDSIPDIDLYHIQGLWEYLGHGVAKYARHHQKPYMITLRGMLYPVGLNHSKLIKRLAMALYQRKDLQQAACIQATCVEEMNIYRSLGFTNPVAILPNPIELGSIADSPIPNKDKVKFGYLGRIHPRKRIERLIYAFDKYREEFKDAELVIIGAQDKVYEEFLKSEVIRLGLANVIFTGFLTGHDKECMIDSLSYLVVPSDEENFGNIVPEALIHGVPVIASTGTPWQELEEYNCGWWISNDQESINKTMIEAFRLSKNENVRMGYNGKKLISERYEMDILGQRMKKIYDWILGSCEKPDYVYV